jgi:lysophospholipase
MTHEGSTMQLVSDPYVDSLKGLEVFRVTGAGDKTIRVAFAPAEPKGGKPKNVRGSVIISPGRTEYIEKHATTAIDLVARGFNVLIIDQRGQGWSDRLTANYMAGHLDNYHDAGVHIALAIEAAGTRLSGPHILLCHSMGGCIGLEALLNGNLPTITAAAFSAPMWDINVPFYARTMTKLMMAMGQSEAIAPTTPQDWKPEVFEGNAVTHDAQHFARNNALFLAEPNLQIGGTTNGWLAGAFATMDSFIPERLAKLKLPILVVSAEAETVISNDAHVRVVGQLPNAILRTIPGAKHEMLHERPDLRDQFWSHFDTWLDSLPAAIA